MGRSQVVGLGQSLLNETSRSGKTSVKVNITFNNDGHENGLLFNLKVFRKSAIRNLRNFLEWWADDMTRYMKANHRWRNRSGAAERGIKAHVQGNSNQYATKTTIEIRHGETVWYGWRLENLYGRKYAIIEPTIDLYAPQIIGSFSMQKLYFGRMGW